MAGMPKMESLGVLACVIALRTREFRGTRVLKRRADHSAAVCA